ncbi:MAG: hypothetical protein EHM41_01375 [Chloroflexi bacterium]|nr:MAG: hypothetical protein EHM41_01375 [Chloroflexota bacterium]
MFRVLLRKELFEQIRTSRLFIVAVVLFITGLISPLLAKYTPVILRSIPDLPAGLAGAIPDPTVVDSVAQYIKNISQFGVLLVILFYMGVIAQEKERGTAAMMLVKPVNRTAVVLSKWLAGALVIVAGIAAAAVAGYGYTVYLFKPISIAGFLWLNFLICVFMLVYLSVAIAASAFARSQGTAALYAFGGLALLLILGSLPWISKVMPGALLDWGAAISLGIIPEARWGALVVSILIIVFLLFSASSKFQKEEI